MSKTDYKAIAKAYIQQQLAAPKTKTPLQVRSATQALVEHVMQAAQKTGQDPHALMGAIQSRMQSEAQQGLNPADVQVKRGGIQVNRGPGTIDPDAIQVQRGPGSIDASQMQIQRGQPVAGGGQVTGHLQKAASQAMKSTKSEEKKLSPEGKKLLMDLLTHDENVDPNEFSPSKLDKHAVYPLLDQGMEHGQVEA